MEPLKDALEYVVGLAPATEYNDSLGELYSKKVYRAPLPEPEPLASALEVATLRSFALYLKANIDTLDLGSHLIHVVNPWRVVLVSCLEALHRRREVVMAAGYAPPTNACIDKWTPAEDAIISLMTAFAPTPDRDELLDLLKSISKEKAEIREDDGMAQKVTVQAGITLKATKKTPGPIMLAPFRTFTEVEQPASLFVPRLRDENGVAILLKSADGNAWQVPAIEAVATHLEGLFNGEPPCPIIY